MKTLPCREIQSLLPEFEDDALPAGTAWQVQTHLAACEPCAAMRRESVSVRTLLQALPPAAPSAGFDAALAQRLALTRRPAAVTFRTRPAGTFRRLRPALALSLVLAAGTLAALEPGHAPAPPMPAAPAARPADPEFVADCIAQHRQDAAAEPLADFSAQTLTGRLDGVPAGNAPGRADLSADPSALANPDVSSDPSLL